MMKIGKDSEEEIEREEVQVEKIKIGRKSQGKEEIQAEG